MDPESVAFMGRPASGYLALLAAYTRGPAVRTSGCEATGTRNTGVATLAAFYPPTDLARLSRQKWPSTWRSRCTRPNLLGRHFKPLPNRTEPPAGRLHDLRHACATILLMVGKHPRYVQEMLGHASIAITLDTYSRVIEGMDGGLAVAMDGAL